MVSNVDAFDDVEAGTEGVRRTIGLTDAVVAIAMTLLVLPLVELVPEADAAGIGSLLAAQGDVFLSFVLSFLVIYLFWLAHLSAFAGVDRAGPGLRVLNMLWLLAVAFLPFPTALVGRHATTASVPPYIGTMFVLSALTSAMVELGARARSRAGLGDGRRAARPRWRVVLTWTTTAVFGLCALLGAVNADLGLFSLLLLVAVRAAEVAAPSLTGRWS